MLSLGDQSGNGRRMGLRRLRSREDSPMIGVIIVGIIFAAFVVMVMWGCAIEAKRADDFNETREK